MEGAPQDIRQVREVFCVGGRLYRNALRRYPAVSAGGYWAVQCVEILRYVPEYFQVLDTVGPVPGCFNDTRGIRIFQEYGGVVFHFGIRTSGLI